jgi:PAS domain S-box-containing protein
VQPWLHIRELIDCRRANLTLIDRKTSELVIFEVSTVGNTSIPAGRRLPLAQFEDIIQTLSQNQPIVFSDYRTIADPRPGIQSLMQDGLLSTCSLPLLSKGSLIGMFSMHSDIPFFFDEGKIALGSEVANQVTIAIVQMQLTEALAKNEERLRLSLHASKQGLYDLNVQTGESIVNHEYAEMLGYDPEAFIATNAAWIERLHPDDKAVTAKAYTDYINGLLPEYRVEFRQKTKQGDWKWILSLGSIVEYDGEGKPLRMMGTHTDINERKEAEAKVQEQLRRLSGLRIIDQAISSNFGMEETLNVVLQQLKELLGIDAAAILLVDEHEQLLECAAGQGFDSLEVRNAQLKLSVGYARRAISEKRTIHVPNLLETGGSLADSLKSVGDDLLDYYGTPLVAKGNVLGVMEVYFHTPTNPDHEWLTFFEMLAGQAAIAIENSQLIDGLMRSTQELEQRVKNRTADLLRMNAELEHANRIKDEFLANMSHELRTPLTGILGLAETLQFGTYGQLNEKQAKYLQTIEASGRHLLSLINDILDLAKIEAGKFDIYPEMISLDDTCRASLLFVKELAHKKSVVLEYQAAKDVKSIFADARRLKQILINLLSNAVKFTPEKGHVTLTVHTDAKKEQIHLSVIDSGIGIAQADLDRLFTPFTQVDSRLNRQYEGTGLGLALVLRLAEMHGGSVQVESQVGVGSRFTVSLPWQPQVLTHTQTPNVQAPLPTPEQVAPNSRGVLLLAEDSPTNILAMGDYLEFKGYTLVVASNGMDALVKAEENDPDLILMDIQMPLMDGLEATRRLRADPRFASTPIIALTALAMTGDREKCIQAGANDYLSKPVRLKELAEKIEQLLQ